MNLHNLELESVYAKGEDGEFHLVARRDECETPATAEKKYIERGEAEKRLFQRAEIANSAYIDQTPSQIMMLAQNVVHLIPAADVRPVVTCGECKHKGWVQEPEHGKSVDYCRLIERCVDKQFFCAAGEKREGN